MTPLPACRDRRGGKCYALGGTFFEPTVLTEWLADAYVLIGRHRLFEQLVGLCNDVGLLAEEYDTGAQRLVGNFSQAFSHRALVNTAHNIAHATKPCEQRSGNAWLAEAAE